MRRPLHGCPAAIELPGAHAPCACAEYAARFGQPPPAERCPFQETAAEMQARHEHDRAAVEAATARALRELTRAVAAAESEADALAALAERGRAH